MPRLRTLTIGLAATTMSGALALGGIATSATAAAHHAPNAAQKKSGTTLKTRHTDLGTFLVDKKGNSLYLFEKDDEKPTSRCYHACASTWPPLLTKGKPVAAGKVKSSLLGTTKRKNGDKQVTYNGSPLYYYAGDSNAGDLNGEGVTQYGAEWTVISSAGKGIDND